MYRWYNRFQSWWIHSNDDDDHYIDDEGSNRRTLHWLEPFSPLTSRIMTLSSSSDNSNGNSKYHSPPNEQQQQQSLLPKRYLYIGWNMIQIQEIDFVHNIETNVTFFILPEEDFGALVKHTTITHLLLPLSSSSQSQTTTNNHRRHYGSDDDDDDTITISILDGLTNILPAVGTGIVDGSATSGSRTSSSTTSSLLEDYTVVDSPYINNVNNETTTLQMPFYRLSMIPPTQINSNTNSYDAAMTATLRPEMGHWCISIVDSINDDDDDDDNEGPALLPILYNPMILFGDDTTLLRPIRLQEQTISDLLESNDEGSKHGGFVPSAFAAATDVTLRPGQSITISSFYGTADHILDVPVIARRLLQPGFVSFKLARANELGQQVISAIESHTSNPLWDGHVQQMILDNSLLGGIPQIVGEDNDDSKLRCTDEDGRLKVLHLFSHIHGDIGGRDYTSVEIAPTFFSNVRYFMF